MQDLITIIIPIYNVDKYVERCVESVLSQSYEKIEIILVDDGSRDKCPEICDAYAKRDRRIKVIHKNNGGLSDARNSGLAIAKGKYVSFIDGDDYVHPYYLEHLYKILLSSSSDISCCDLCYFSEKNHAKTVDDGSKEDETLTVKNSTDALEMMFYKKTFKNSACAKLYRTDIFNGLRFPKGKLCEDLGIMYKIFDKAGRIVSSKMKYYYYMQREGSIIHSKYTPRRIDGLIFASAQTEYIKKKHPQITKAALHREFIEAIYVIISMGPFTNDNKSKKIIMRSIKETRKTVILDNKAPIKSRIIAAISYCGFYPLKTIIAIKKWI